MFALFIYLILARTVFNRVVPRPAIGIWMAQPPVDASPVGVCLYVYVCPCMCRRAAEERIVIYSRGSDLENNFSKRTAQNKTKIGKKEKEKSIGLAASEGSFL